MSTSDDDLRVRYLAACHAMQSGVAWEMNSNEIESATDPKNLRVGVNAAMCDLGALAKLLVRKGVVTQREIDEALTEMMEAEVRRYEERASRVTGVSVKFR
jgi:hypothetical protein